MNGNAFAVFNACFLDAAYGWECAEVLEMIKNRLQNDLFKSSFEVSGSRRKQNNAKKGSDQRSVRETFWVNCGEQKQKHLTLAVSWF